MSALIKPQKRVSLSVVSTSVSIKAKNWSSFFINRFWFKQAATSKEQAINNELLNNLHSFPQFGRCQSINRCSEPQSLSPSLTAHYQLPIKSSSKINLSTVCQRSLVAKRPNMQTTLLLHYGSGKEIRTVLQKLTRYGISQLRNLTAQNTYFKF